MKLDTRKIILPEGSFDIKVQVFEELDRSRLFDIYKDWRKLCKNLSSIRSRSINLPEGLSEGAFCLEMKAVRMIETIGGANTSFDCFNLTSQKRIQVKACSVLPDLTSFGPKSVWDEIYFMDFYSEGKWDGTFNIYRIENNLIYNHKVNATQTFVDQQRQKRRPRFSLFKDIIEKRGLTPIKKGNLSTAID